MILDGHFNPFFSFDLILQDFSRFSSHAAQKFERLNWHTASGYTSCIMSEVRQKATKNVTNTAMFGK
jgi:hypothetical protein